MKYLATFFATALLCGAAAHADTVYDNGGYGTVTGYNFSNPSSADDFQLASDASIDGITFWAYSNDVSNLASIGWGFFLDAAGYPGTEVTSGLATSTSVTDTTDSLSGFSIYEVVIPIPTVVLTGGTTYWLALDSGPLFTNTTAGFSGWVFSDEAVDGNFAAYGQPGNWNRSASSYPYDNAFLLSGTAAPVPLPASAVLLLGAVGGLAAARRLRRKG